MENTELNPWAERDAQAAAESVGVEVKWRTFSFTVKRRASWSKDYEAAVARVRVRPKYRALLKALERRGYEMTASDRALTQEMTDIAMIDGCIVSWDVKGRDGSPLKFNLDNALMLLDTFPQLREFLTEATGSDDTFSAEPSVDEKLGN